jgi:hypothetical protein
MIDDFFSQLALASKGVWRKGHKFGNSGYKELKTKSYQFYLSHPSGEVIEGVQSYS